MATCIWCLKSDAPPSIEHIFPEALGCPKEFVLTGGVVCEACNNGMSHLDRAVIDDFDMLAYLANVPRKGGRPPMIRGRGNLVANRGRAGPEMSINMDAQSRVAHDGSPLGAFGKSERNVSATLNREGNLGRISFSTVIGKNPKFGRGITKIGFSSLAYFLGSETALEEMFNPVRAFVRSGTGKRPVLMMASEDPKYGHEARPPCKSVAGEYVVSFRLAVAEFIVDLGPTLSSSTKFTEELERNGTQGWTWL